MATKRKAAEDARAAIAEQAAQRKRAKSSATAKTSTGQGAVETGVTQDSVEKKIPDSSRDEVATANAAGLQHAEDEDRSKVSVGSGPGLVKAVRGGSSSKASQTQNTLSEAENISTPRGKTSGTQGKDRNASTSAKSAPVDKRSNKKPQIEQGIAKSPLDTSNKVAQSDSSEGEELQAVRKTRGKGTRASLKAQMTPESGNEGTKHAPSKAEKRVKARNEDKHVTKPGRKDKMRAVTVIWSGRPQRRIVYTSVSFRASNDTDAKTYRSTNLQAFCFKHSRRMEPPKRVDWTSPVESTASDGVFRPVKKTIQPVSPSTFRTITAPPRPKEMAKDEAWYAQELAAFEKVNQKPHDDAQEMQQEYHQQTRNADAAFVKAIV
ncbi:uncharacterized protein MYCFIDRAFT_196527 [Pseudocercospora fijiensis CIRAD86]|uniref:Uncharacterized protein n=1 Tax=Pseudocercospora fijiensis (strain CIRAD86) TaxID=383855 RepID=M2YZX9_PSEFD|nr:uncharacterized protein MYCFIDRAFT_196527 [Pseudocercospora fijiensis CIRAD86]EME83170.1 hypothetical protein MYCFIDRAFT_196527 [Pseudocercospora fijiensis CIRAD86]